MTWRELQFKIGNMADNQLNKEVPIFHFLVGGIALLNACLYVGENKDIDTHCEDIDDFQHEYYLLCGKPNVKL